MVMYEAAFIKSEDAIPLLQSCRQIHEEALPTLYHSPAAFSSQASFLALQAQQLFGGHIIRLVGEQAGHRAQAPLEGVDCIWLGCWRVRVWTVNVRPIASAAFIWAVCARARAFLGG